MPTGDFFGMSDAWHHPVDLNYDCFIGFKDASMPLTQPSQHNTAITYDVWLLRFIYYAAYSHLSVLGSLNSASLDHFGRVFTQTELYNGFTAYWPAGSGWGQMKIYGNWYIRLY
jgi:hypothetical protein